MPDETSAAAPSDVYDYEQDSGDEPAADEPSGAVDDRDADDESGLDSPDAGGEAASDDGGRGRFSRLDGADYDRVNDFLEARVAFTAREWAVARLCADFRTATGVEMTRVGEHLPELVTFVDEPYTRQAVCAARRDFREKVREAAATFLYGAFADFLTAEEVDEVVYEATEVAKFLIEVEGATLAVGDELSTEARVRDAMQAVHESSLGLRYDRCPHCDEELGADAAATDPA